MRILSRNVALGALLVACASVGLSGCGGDSSDQTFVQHGQVEQWLVDHECDETGAAAGSPGYSMDGRIVQVTFVCDNGKTFDLKLQDDDTWTYTEK